MKEILEFVYDFSSGEGIRDTLIPSLKIIKTSSANVKTHSVCKPSLCVVIQGKKIVSLGNLTLSYSPGEFIVTTVDLPVTGKVTTASQKKPYYCLMLELDPVMIFEVSKEQTSVKIKNAKRGIFVGNVDSDMEGAFKRLLECLKSPNDVSILAPLIIREITYRLLGTEHGDAIKQLGIVGSQTQRIAKVIDVIKRDFSSALKIPNLAKEAGMSPASFHKYFKAITAMSPLQFQKQLRLQEARRLLIMGQLDAGSVGYEVGYESPSQFSREYARMFGFPPKLDSERSKNKEG